jgi:hypothetical protein
VAIAMYLNCSHYDALNCSRCDALNYGRCQGKRRARRLGREKIAKFKLAAVKMRLPRKI